MNCKDIVEKYLSELKSNFITEPTKYGCNVITPYMAFNGEPLSFYVEEKGEYLRITDGGNTLLDLKTINVNTNSGNERELYTEILKLYQIGETNGEIFVDADINNFAQRLIFYLDAIHSLYDLEFFVKPSRRKSFHKAVSEYCDVNDLKCDYLKTITIGTFEHTIDIMSKNHANLIQTVGTTEIQPTLKAFAGKKMFPFLELEIPKYKTEKDKYDRVVIYDEIIDWDVQSMDLMKEFSDNIYTWKNTKKEKILEDLLEV